MAPDPSSVPGAKRTALPREVEAQLATLVDHAPPGEDWIHEIKFDGYRMLCRVDGGRARLTTRRGKDWTAHFPTVAKAVTTLSASRAILDGELVSVDEQGKSSFQDFQNAMSEGREADLHYYAFDLLHLDGWDLRGSPLVERKRLLRTLLERGGGDGRVLYSDHVEGQGPEFHRNACAMGLEGIVSKMAARPHVSGRTREWLKVKCSRGQEFVIGGFTPPEGARTGIGALLVGVHDGQGRLAYAGKVGTGFTEATLRDLRDRLGRLARPEPAFHDPPRGAPVRGVTWVEPSLVAEVRFAEWTRDGRLRHPSFQGLREDKPASKVVRERPADAGGTSHPGEEVPVTRAKPKTEAKPRPAAKPKAPARAKVASKPPTPAPKKPRVSVEGSPVVAGVRLSNPGRVLYPGERLTKEDVARYYEAVAERMLPFVDRRPLTLVRCPEGHTAECFYQKHGGLGTPEAIHRIPVPERGKTAEYLMVDSPAGLVSLVQMGVLEVHVWGSTTKRLEQPDQIVMDLDPDPDLPWERMVEAARLVRERLESFGLEAFVKTTGGKGLHVVSPLVPRADWDEVKAFTKAIADRLSAEQPDRYLAVMTKAKRVGKIFVDYLRNGRGATAIAPWSTRARAGATVAAPIRWDELGPGIAPGKRPFHVGNVPERAASTDAWAGYEKARRPLTPKALKAAGVG